MNTYTLKRQVLISEKDYMKLRKHCLVKSLYGNRNLYDTCDWRPITDKDYLILVIKGEANSNSLDDVTNFVLNQNERFYSRNYMYKKFCFKDNVIQMLNKRGRGSQKFGWATMTKVFEKKQ